MHGQIANWTGKQTVRPLPANDRSNVMPTLKFWIQLDNRPWDASPHNIDRVSGVDMTSDGAYPPKSAKETAPWQFTIDATSTA